jgi:hypothetical protein
MIHSKRLPLLVFTLAIGAEGLLAPSSAEAVRRVYSSSGQWSIQAALEADLDDENDYQGGRFSLMRETYRNSAVRINIGFMERQSDLSDDQVFVGDDFTFALSRPYDHDVDAGYISAQYLFYPARQRKLDLYWGLGPRISVADIRPGLRILDDYYFPYPWVEEVSLTEATQLGVGLDASVGMEFFLAPNVSFLAEYGLTLEHRWYFLQFDYYDYHGADMEHHEWFDDDVYFDASQIRLGMAVYF